MKLQDKVAVVTGAGGGLGRAIAKAMAAEGAKLVLCDINEKTLKETEAELIETGTGTLTVECDISSSAEVAQMFSAVKHRFGTVHILVNNAAIVPGDPAGLERNARYMALMTTPIPRQSLRVTSQMSDEEWHRFWGANVHGTFYCTREALKFMEPQKEGKIINIASVSGTSSAAAHRPHYSASKGAVVAFTKSVGYEVAGANIYVNCIAPGAILTPDAEAYFDQAPPEALNRFFQIIPAGRIGRPEEYASLAVYLAWDGHYLVGQILSPNGGVVI